MKKLLLSLLTLGMFSPLAIVSLEKPATPDVDIETLKIEESLGEHPQERLLLQKRLADLDKSVLQKRIEELSEKAKKESGKALEKIKSRINYYKEALRAKLK